MLSVMQGANPYSHNWGEFVEDELTVATRQ